jgi:glucose-6-phosphate 1-dehydrogenase
VGDRDIPAYVDEDGVTPEHGTETFAEVVLELDGRRWSGTRFRLRTGKALARDRKEVVVHFRSALPLPRDGSEEPAPNRLTFELEPEGADLALTSTDPGAYGRILLDVLRGNSSLSIRADEAERAWQIVAPVLDGWSRNLVPLEEYDAGSNGPEAEEWA